MVLIDATMLLLWLNPQAPAPSPPAGFLGPLDAAARVDHLIRTLETKRTKVLIPTPALAEVLVNSGRAGQGYLARIEKSSAFRFGSFDPQAAVEVAAMTKAALASGSKRGTAPDQDTWAKIKYDRQIVAIGKAKGVTGIYSDDGGVRTLGDAAGIPVIGVYECPLPPTPPQHELPFRPPAQEVRNDPEANPV